MTALQRPQLESSPAPSLTILLRFEDESYIELYNSERRVWKQAGKLSKLVGFSSHLRREWKVVLLAGTCGVSITLALLTFRSSVQNVPVSGVSRNERPLLNKTEEDDRLRIRNRRLEALIEVLRGRSSHPRSAPVH